MGASDPFGDPSRGSRFTVLSFGITAEVGGGGIPTDQPAPGLSPSETADGDELA